MTTGLQFREPEPGQEPGQGSTERRQEDPSLSLLQCSLHVPLPTFSCLLLCFPLVSPMSMCRFLQVANGPPAKSYHLSAQRTMNSPLPTGKIEASASSLWPLRHTELSGFPWLSLVPGASGPCSEPSRLGAGEGENSMSAFRELPGDFPCPRCKALAAHPSPLSPALISPVHF